MAKAVKRNVKKGKPIKKTKVKVGVETNLIRRVTLKASNTKIPAFGSGDSVVVYVKVKEGEKERVQAYKGVVIKLQGAGTGRSFTVRKISSGVGVERTFPFNSPLIDRVELLATGKVRRSKLYYLRERDGKAAKIESEMVTAGSSHHTSSTSEEQQQES